MTLNARWTRVADLVEVLRRRWERGVYLRTYAAGEPWEVVRLPVKRPAALDLCDDLDGVIAWANQFRRDSQTSKGQPRFAVEHRVVGGRGMGTNELPSAILIETFDQLCALLGVTIDVSHLDTILGITRERQPLIESWVINNPRVAVENHDQWPDLIATVNWIAVRETSSLYVRHLDLEGIDTKFVERHQRVLGDLLRVVLAPERVQLDATGFAARYGFRTKPDYTRFRLLSPIPQFPVALTELRVRTRELAAIELPVKTVFVVENEISYLAFPDLPDAIVIFGEGFHVATLEHVEWLREKEIVYWGDIDTYGFAILNRVRARFANVRSMLMDRATLLAHPRQLVVESTPTREALDHLTDEEAALYRDLIEDRYGNAVRLEQERIRFSLVREALSAWEMDTRVGPATPHP